MNLHMWNKVAITKHLQALADKKDCAWTKWVHIYYIKNEPIESCEIQKGYLGSQKIHRLNKSYYESPWFTRRLAELVDILC